MTAINIHNVRFYDFTPKAIHCMAYNDSSELLALTRSDNNIEIWNCKEKAFKQLEIIGDHNSSIEALVWCENRLMSAGLHGFILEYDLQSMDIKNKVAVTGGPTWCLAVSPNRKLLAAGTEAGFLCIFDVTEEGMIYQKNFERQSNRILSIGWHANSNFLVTGSIGSVHLLSIKEGQILQFPVAMTSNVKETIVWCIELLDDMTIVTGDSRGKTCFWDGNHGTLIDGIQSHQADVLSMQVSKSNRSIFVAGVDPLIYEISFGGNHWVRGIARRIHTHDVRAMVLTKKGKLYSGGGDTYLACSSYPPKTLIKYPSTPPVGYLSLAKKTNCILLGYEEKLELWQLGEAQFNENSASLSMSLAKDRVRLLELHLKKNCKLQYCALSPNCKCIAYVIEGKLKIFRFTPPKDGREIELSKLCCSQSNQILHSTQIHWFDDITLVSTTSSTVIQIITIYSNEFALNCNFEVPHGSHVRLMTTSETFKCVGISDSEDRVHVYYLEEEKWKTLPHIHSAPTAIALDDSSPYVVASYSNNLVVQYNLIDEAYTKYTQYIIGHLYEELKKRNFTIQSISFHDNNTDLIFLHDISSLIIMNQKENFEIDNKSTPLKYAKLDNMDNESNSNSSVKSSFIGSLPIIPRSNHVMLFSYLSNNNAVSIEINPIWLLDSLPPTLRVKKFGAK